MRLIDVDGDVFDHRVIAHGVNCDGHMGGGVARDVADTWPILNANYKIACQIGVIRPGMSWPFWIDNDTLVFNLATQDVAGPAARIEWVILAVQDMARQCERLGIEEVAIVQIGCGIGGLAWPDVRAALEAIPADLTLRVVTPAVTA